MKRPSFQFYPADWRANAKLRRCTFAERGVWLEVMCLLHDSDEYGVLRWPLKDVSRTLGVRQSVLQSLHKKLVLKGADVGERCEGFTYTPRHAGQAGDPVELIESQDGPLWYSSRMVVDEYVRQRRGQASRFGNGNQPPKPQPKPKPKPPIGDGKGDGPTSSSSSKNYAADADEKPSSGGTKEAIWNLGVSVLCRAGDSEKQARAFLGKFAKDEGKLAKVISYLAANPKVQPKAYIAKAMQPDKPRLAL